MVKILSFENEKEKQFSFCILLTYSYFELISKILSFENEKEKQFSFCILLTYSYLCNINL